MSKIWRFKCLKCDKETEDGLNHGDKILLNLLRHVDMIKALLDSDESGYIEISIMSSGTEPIDFLMEHYGYGHDVVIHSEYGDIERTDDRIDDVKEKYNTNLAKDLANEVKSMKRQFILKGQHLELLRNMCVEWDDCEFGAPVIDCKRPYGNSNVYKDIAKIIGIGIDGFKDSDDEIHFSEEQISIMKNIHKETEVALQIVLITGKFETGVYVAEEYNDNWRKIA